MRIGAAIDRGAECQFRVRHPPWGLLHADGTGTADQVRFAIARGAEFLRRHQRRDGSWRGFLLYPGASSAWLTAHVAFVVDAVPQLRGACARAAAYLQSIGANDGGWGYNRRVGVDCDSWSQALMVLADHSLACEDFLVRNLAALQLDGGGFPTYPAHGDSTRGARHGWQAAHPEVTVMAMEALRRRGGWEDRVARCRDWLRGASSNGVLPSYWWQDDCYSLWAQARTGLLEPATSSCVEAALSTNAALPQLAMALTAAAELGLPDAILREGARRMLLTQRADGSWLCAPCLRVTDPRHAAPGPDAPGIVVADRRRVFSTAHAVAALVRIERRLFPSAVPTSPPSRA